MPEIKLKARIQNKYETLEEWNKLLKNEFIPLKGEVCYGVDNDTLYQKIGDGETDFVDLPWLLNQADNEENDETSPAYIKNRLAYPEYTEVSEDEQNLYIDKFIALELFEDKLITPVADLASVWGDDILDYFPETSNIIVGYPYDSDGVIYTDRVDDLLNQYNQLQIKMQGEETEKIWDFAYNTKVLKTSTFTQEGYTISCLGNSNWANILMNFIGDTMSSPVDYFTPEETTDKYCFIFVGPIVTDGEAMLMTYMGVDCDYYKPNTVAETDTSTTPETITTSYEYPFAFQLLARGQMHTIDKKYLGEINADQHELDSSKHSYIKNKYGEFATINIKEDAAKTEYGYYEGKITLASFDVLGMWGVKSETVLSHFPSNLEKTLTTCKVIIDGTTYNNCRLFKNASSLNAADKAGAISSYYLGNPKYLSDYLIKFYSYMDPETTENSYVTNLEDNRLPFLFEFDFNSATPLKSGNFTKFSGYNDNDSLTISVIPETVILGINPLNSNFLETQSVVGVYNEENNSVLLNSAYEASGSNSFASGYGTKAIGYNSVAFNNNTLAQAENSFAFGKETKTIGANSVAGGQDTIANDNHTVAFGRGSWARGIGSVAMGDCISETSSILRVNSQNIYVSNLDRTDYDFAQLTYIDEDNNTRKTPWFKVFNSSVNIEDNGEYRIYLSTSDGNEQLSNYSSEFSSIELRVVNRTQLSSSFALGRGARANGQGSFALGDDTIASDYYQFAIGRCNKVANGAFIIGNGSHPNYSTTPNRSNALVIDWSGNATFAGSVKATSLILTSPNGTKFNITVDDNGLLSATQI